MRRGAVHEQIAFFRISLVFDLQNAEETALLMNHPVFSFTRKRSITRGNEERCDSQAKADWRAGRMKLPLADNAEFIPLPPDAQQSAGAMS